MFNISSFLEKVSKNILSSSLQKKQIIEVIKKETGVEVSEADIELRECVLYIKSSPALKNKLFIQKSKILEELSGQSNTKIIDIK